MFASHATQPPRRFPGTHSGHVYAFLLGAACTLGARADDAEVGKRLREKGAKVTETKGGVTAVTVSDPSKVTDDDFRQLGKLSRLKTLDLNNCLNDDRLALLAGLTELEYLQTNLAQVTDDGLKPVAKLTGLKTVKFFHPGKAFSGAGLVHLAELPNLERLTVGGMAAVGKLTRLKEFRMWHAGPTDEGVKRLKALPDLRSLHLGQRLTYKPPACPSDETLAVLAELRSLETLHLDEARLTFAALQQLKRLPALKQLNLGGVEIAAADVERLRKELPRVKVEWTPPNETFRKLIRALFGG
jgi:hypothetical protein